MVALRWRPTNAYNSNAAWRRQMPSKSLCPDCGMKNRGASHLCDPMRVEKHTQKKKRLAKLESK